MSEVLNIHDDDVDLEFEISGLCFEANQVKRFSHCDGWFTEKVGSSPGPLISDFVTHGPEFEYSTSGIHVGQTDRLTFFGSPTRTIFGHFVDCREGSATLHKQLSIGFSPSSRRKLIIPRGVAHTFDGLAGIVTRDEPVWFSSERNPHWNVTNDLVSILRTETSFPTIAVNELPLSDELHLYMARLQQAVLHDPKSYMTRFELEIGGKRQYIMFEDQTWINEGRSVEDLIRAFDNAGVSVCKSKYAITGKASWTLVPNTSSAVCDVVWLPESSTAGDSHFLHTRTRKWYTILTSEGKPFTLSTLDLRRQSESCGRRQLTRSTADPRVSFCIEPGVAYRFELSEGAYLRTESEILLSEAEPDATLKPIGSDLVVIKASNLSEPTYDLPALSASDAIVRRIAAYESQL